MEDKSKLDLDAIAKECNLFEETQDAVSKIKALENTYERDDLVTI